MRLAGLPVETDVTVGSWLATALRPVGSGVDAVVPPVFEAYARIFHPAVRYVGDIDVEVTWAEVAAVNGRTAHPLMQWVGITGDWDYLLEDAQPPAWDRAPDEGHLPATLAGRLGAVLGHHTGTPEDCVLAVWGGFGWVPAGAPRLPLPGAHDVVLLRGEVADAVSDLAPEPFQQSVNLWWPADRAWFVATDVDLMCTYVGGSAGCVAELLDAPGLEVAPASPDDPTGHADDPVNPVPPRG